MRRKLLFNLALVYLLGMIIFSCQMNSDDEYVEQTYEQEITKLNIYLDSLEARGYDVDTTALGVYYVTIEEGEGEFPKTGDQLEVIYSGYLIDGYLFDSSKLTQADSTWEFELGNPAMIPGWDDGMKVINKGAQVQLIIQSKLAYGIYGSGEIPPNNTLLFVVDMVNIEPS